MRLQIGATCESPTTLTTNDVTTVPFLDKRSAANQHLGRSAVGIADGGKIQRRAETQVVLE